MNNEQVVGVAAQLYECRKSARSLLGQHYKRDMDAWALVIRYTASTEKCSELAAANKLARDTDGFGAVVILAAFVEMIEPSVD